MVSSSKTVFFEPGAPRQPPRQVWRAFRAPPCPACGVMERWPKGGVAMCPSGAVQKSAHGVVAPSCDFWNGDTRKFLGHWPIGSHEDVRAKACENPCRYRGERITLPNLRLREPVR